MEWLWGSAVSNRAKVAGAEYFLRVEIFDSFGEDAFRVKITNGKQ